MWCMQYSTQAKTRLSDCAVRNYATAEGDRAFFYLIVRNPNVYFCLLTYLNLREIFSLNQVSRVTASAIMDPVTYLPLQNFFMNRHNVPMHELLKHQRAIYSSKKQYDLIDYYYHFTCWRRINDVHHMERLNPHQDKLITMCLNSFISAFLLFVGLMCYEAILPTEPLENTLQLILSDYVVCFSVVFLLVILSFCAYSNCVTPLRFYFDKKKRLNQVQHDILVQNNLNRFFTANCGFVSVATAEQDQLESGADGMDDNALHQSLLDLPV